MSQDDQSYTIGVEEEYQVVHSQTRELCGSAGQVLDTARKQLGERVQPELQRSQIEVLTPVCKTLQEVREEIVCLRRAVIDAAVADGNHIVAAATHPISHWRDQQVTPKETYEWLADRYGQLAQEQVVFGCHVHVGMEDREAAVQVLNRARVWLAPLLALSASSPYWLANDTDHASYRTVVWGRFPISGVPGFFVSAAEYDATVRELIDTGSALDEAKIYWDVRLPARLPTVEFRVADVCQTVDEAVMLTGLVRALVRTCHQDASRAEPCPPTRSELLRAAQWRAARYGLEGDLIDIAAGRSVPAKDLVRGLLRRVRPALEDAGDWEDVAGLVDQTLQDGNGATRQRRAFARAGRMEDVVDLLIEETCRGTGVSQGA